MHQNITRRSVAKGAAWSVPVIAATSNVPAMAASTPTPEGCALTDDQLNNGYCGTRVADSWAIEGSRTFGNQFGGAANAQTSLNIGFRSTCNYRGSVTFKLKNASGERTLPSPTLTLNDGRSFSGVATLGNVGSGGARAGFLMASTIQWLDSAGTTNRSNRQSWDGATVRVPTEISYTAPNGTLHRCLLTYTFTMQGSWNASGSQAMVSPRWASAAPLS